MRISIHAVKRVAPALVALAVAVPAAPAQQPADPTPERIETLARVHLEITEARDAFHREIGRVHEEQSRLRARETLGSRVAAALEQAGVTREEYDRFILIVSIDADVRAEFDAVLARLIEERGGVGEPRGGR